MIAGHGLCWTLSSIPGCPASLSRWRHAPTVACLGDDVGDVVLIVKDVEERASASSGGHCSLQPAARSQTRGEHRVVFMVRWGMERAM